MSTLFERYRSVGQDKITEVIVRLAQRGLGGLKGEKMDLSKRLRAAAAKAIDDGAITAAIIADFSGGRPLGRSILVCRSDTGEIVDGIACPTYLRQIGCVWYLSAFERIEELVWVRDVAGAWITLQFSPHDDVDLIVRRLNGLRL